MCIRDRYDAGTNAIFSITKEMCRFLMAILNSNGEIEVAFLLPEPYRYDIHKSSKDQSLHGTPSF